MEVYIYLILTILIWGIAPVMDKAALRGGDAVSGSLVRGMTIGIATLVFIASTGRWRDVTNLSTKTITYFAVSGLLAGFIGVFTYFAALKLAPASRIVPLASIYPLVTALISAAFLHEPLTVPRVIGIALISAGVLLVK